MTRFVGYIAMSIDGCIADGNGRMDWLEEFSDPDDDFGYAEFFDGVDAIVMGRSTYEFVSAQPVWPYPGVSTYVVTSRLVPGGDARIETIAPDFESLRRHLCREGYETVWVMGGGQTQRGALDAGMFDELQLFVMPLILGSGPLIFADGAATRAQLADHAVLRGGVVRLSYRF